MVQTNTIKEKSIREDIQDLVANVIRPNAEIIDKEGSFPRENLNHLAKAGWNSILIPEKYDGLGLDYEAFSIATEEIAKGCPSTALVYVMHVGAAQTIVYYGNEDQKQRWLPPVRNGNIGTHSMSEKATGGHTWFSLSEAKRDGEDYVLDLEKSFTTSGGQSAFYILQTRTPGAEKPTDLSYFIVDGKHPGISAGSWDALGVHGNHSGPLKLEGVTVKRQDLLWEENKAVEIAINGVDPLYMLGMGSAFLGVAEDALEKAIDHVKKTIHRDFNKSLADYQVIRGQLADAKILISSLKPWQIELAKKFNQFEAEGKAFGELFYDSVEFKVYATQVANKVANVAMDVTGGYGYKKGPIERLYRDARAGIVLAPSNLLAKDIIGKNLVGLPSEFFEEGGE
ncbi:acyl-CoA dehydrogenase family protein [Bacillus sp. T3]|uniref:acyl-CoA dehydrogenase family protein n=1 Tax=Bacillus sp. T3 TaxID=467262 RepID=UPI00298178D8|nr:acyl-CoA dehydrogenase family protein [Bacillus sp. T3]